MPCSCCCLILEVPNHLHLLPWTLMFLTSALCYFGEHPHNCHKNVSTVLSLHVSCFAQSPSIMKFPKAENVLNQEKCYWTSLSKMNRRTKKKKIRKFYFNSPYSPSNSQTTFLLILNPTLMQNTNRLYLRYPGPQLPALKMRKAPEVCPLRTLLYICYIWLLKTLLPIRTD